MGEVRKVRSSTKQAGNRGLGRKKGVPNKVTADVRALAQQYVPGAVKCLAEIMDDQAQPAAARVSAAKEILDRACGKAPQPVVGGNADFAALFGQIMQGLPN